MARLLTILIALMAQGMASMSPLCFVRCVSPNGHVCMELAGQSCHCCDCQSRAQSPQVCAVTTCCHHHKDKDPDQDKHDAPVGWQVRCEHCSCQHSLLESAPQVQNKSRAADVMLAWHDVLLAPTTFVAAATASRLEFASHWLLRPQESPQLAVLATVVLRV